MKIAVISHCTIDSIVLDGSQNDVAGGPACYCAFTSKNLKFDVDLFTKYGPDFPLQQKLLDQKISTYNPLSETKKPNQGEIKSQTLYSEPEGLNTKKELPTIDKNSFKKGVYY